MKKTIVLGSVSLLIGAVVGFAATTIEFNSAGDHFVEMIRSNDLGDGDQTSRYQGEVSVPNGETYDFGVMDQFGTGRHTFLVQNTGLGPLDIAMIQTTCRCTSADMAEGESVTLQPGEDKEVTLEWTVKEYGESFSQAATLRTSDPMRPSVRLTVEGRISSLLSLEPDSIVMPNLSSKREATDVMYVYSYKDDNLKCSEVRQANAALAQFLDVEVTKMPAEMVAKKERCKSGLVINITAKSGIPLGPFRQQVKLQTNMKNESAINFDIEGNVVGDISIWTREKFSQNRQLLNLALIKRGQRRKAELQVIVKGEHMASTEVKLDESLTDPAGVLKATLGKPVAMGKKARRFPLTIEVDAGDRAISRLARADEDNFGKVVLKTTHPDAPEIVISVSFATGG